MQDRDWPEILRPHDFSATYASLTDVLESGLSMDDAAKRRGVDVEILKGEFLFVSAATLDLCDELERRQSVEAAHW
jgi:hypothetical protein